MMIQTDKLYQHSCRPDSAAGVCRSRGGESCAFDGAMIVLQCIADAAHLVHGPIACFGNSWESRGTISDQGILHRRAYTTDLGEMDIVYGAEEKLLSAIRETSRDSGAKAVFVYLTCVTGLIGDDVEVVCKKARSELGIRAIPVQCPGFVGPKHLGNRIAGEVLLDHVIGTGKPSRDHTPSRDRIRERNPARRGTGFQPVDRQDAGSTKGAEPSINLIGEYNIAGDLQQVEPILKRAGVPILSRITGNATFEEITHAHRAKLNVMVCSRALINVAREMERRYGIPYVEVSFFGKTEMSKALRAIAGGLRCAGSDLEGRIERVIESEERTLAERLRPYTFLRGKRAVLYSGGVKGWSFISALMDLGIEVVAVGTAKSTAEDEEKMKALLGPEAPLYENMEPKYILTLMARPSSLANPVNANVLHNDLNINYPPLPPLRKGGMGGFFSENGNSYAMNIFTERLMKEHRADILIAGGRNQYLAIKEGFPFVDVNQERHTPYAGYDGLVNLAEQIAVAYNFYHPSSSAQSSKLEARSHGDLRATRYKPTSTQPSRSSNRAATVASLDLTEPRPPRAATVRERTPSSQDLLVRMQQMANRATTVRERTPSPPVSINPLKHSASIGAAMAFQGVDKATVILHGAQGCNFLGKVLLTKHFREPISMVSTRLFVEDVVMGSGERLSRTLREVLEKNGPEVVGILSTGLTEVKGEDIGMTLKEFYGERVTLIHVPTPDYQGGLEEGYAAAVEALVSLAVPAERVERRINLLAGSHLTPADVTELRDTIEDFGLEPHILPDLSALDGSREGYSPIAIGGVSISAIRNMGAASMTVVVGPSLKRAADRLLERCNVPFVVLESATGLAASDRFYRLLSELGRCEIPGRYRRARRVLVDGMRDAMVRWGKKRVALAQEADGALALSTLLEEMGARVPLAVVPTEAPSVRHIRAENVIVGDFNCLRGTFDLLVASSHGDQTAESLRAPHFEWGFPVFERLGINASVTVGYQGTLQMVNQIGNALSKAH